MRMRMMVCDCLEVSRALGHICKEQKRLPPTNTKTLPFLADVTESPRTHIQGTVVYSRCKKQKDLSFL